MPVDNQLYDTLAGSWWDESGVILRIRRLPRPLGLPAGTHARGSREAGGGVYGLAFRAPSIPVDVIMMHDIDEEDDPLVNTKYDPVTTIDPSFAIELVRVDRLDPESGRIGLLDEGHGGFIASRLPVST
jgi:hypothetical protein